MGIESPVHLLFIAVVALIVLGPKRLPELARALGQGIREFRQSLDEGADPPEPAAAPAQTVAPAASASSATPAPTPPQRLRRLDGSRSAGAGAARRGRARARLIARRPADCAGSAAPG